MRPNATRAKCRMHDESSDFPSRFFSTHAYKSLIQAIVDFLEAILIPEPQPVPVPATPSKPEKRK